MRQIFKDLYRNIINDNKISRFKRGSIQYIPLVKPGKNTEKNGGDHYLWSPP